MNDYTPTLQKPVAPLGDIGINVFLFASGVPADKWIEYADAWRQLGVTDLSVDFTGCGYTTADQHIAALQQGAEHLGLRPS